MIREKLKNGVKIVMSLLPMSLGMTPTPIMAQQDNPEWTTWAEVSKNPSVEGLSYFIVNNPNSPHADEAFCALYNISNAAADGVMAMTAATPNTAELCVDVAGAAAASPVRLMNS